MSRTTPDAASIPAPWVSLEADQLELEAYVTARLGIDRDDDVSVSPVEPDWMDEAISATWPVVLAEAEMARC